jgi:TusA-related sulfurtransferase
MADENELKINARGLSAPGPRLMVKTALDENPRRPLRVVVSNSDAADDLKEYASEIGATAKVDQVGEVFHVFVEFGDS